MRTPTFELDRSPAALTATLEVDSPMMQAPERRWLWSCFRRRRAHWRFSAKRDVLILAGSWELLITNLLPYKCPALYQARRAIQLKEQRSIPYWSGEVDGNLRHDHRHCGHGHIDCAVVFLHFLVIYEGRM